MNFSAHKVRKRFGQHWLKDQAVLEKILTAANLKDNDRVLEVGPGRGALTEKLLASKAQSIHAVELDKDLINGLKRKFEKYPRFSLREGDVLSTSLLPPDGIPANKVVANIPYNITAPLLDRLLGRLGKPMKRTYELLILLLQKEVADRILAQPGQNNFSAMSIRLQFLANCHSVCEVPPNCFDPPPKVNSKVIAIEPIKPERRISQELEVQVDLIIRKAFIARRKKLRNTLVGLASRNELERLAESNGISLNQRPQELSKMEWLSLAKGLNKMVINYDNG